MSRITIVECCVDSVATACAAEAAGADRVELCGPSDTGVTPSASLLREVLAAVRIPVHVMIRPREGDFVYTDAEFAEMLAAVDSAKAAGAAAAVFGVLRPDGALDVPRMHALVERADPMLAGCHRAFDATPNADAALDALLELGVNIVLTSGHAKTALDGAATLARHVARVGGQLEILAGGSVRAANVRQIISETQVHAVHVRGLDPQVVSALIAAVRPTR